jgi:hypothetical protein
MATLRSGMLAGKERYLARSSSEADAIHRDQIIPRRGRPVDRGQISRLAVVLDEQVALRCSEGGFVAAAAA